MTGSGGIHGRPVEIRQMDDGYEPDRCASNTEKLIRDAEADGRLPEPDKDPETNRRLGYSLADVNRMREVFGTLPHRELLDHFPCIIDKPIGGLRHGIEREPRLAFQLGVDRLDVVLFLTQVGDALVLPNQPQIDQ